MNHSRVKQKPRDVNEETTSISLSILAFFFFSRIRYFQPRERFICNCGGFSQDIRDAITTGGGLYDRGWGEGGGEGHGLMRLRSLSDVASTSCAVTSTALVCHRTDVVTGGLHDLLPAFPFSRPPFPAVDFFVTIRACDVRPRKMNVFS